MARSMLPVLLLTSVLAAQGGQFRGAGSVVPRPGVALADDLTLWSYLWEFHKDRFVLAGRPANVAADRAAICAAVRPVLARLERDAVQPDLVNACLLAMARIAGPDDAAVLGRLRFRLHDAHPHVRSIAAVALGLAPRAEAEDDLVALVVDSPRGRRLVDKDEVTPRTRVFACYGLALRAHRTRALGTRTRALAVFDAVLRDREFEDEELETAALLGLGLLGPFAGREEVALRRVVLETLGREYRADRSVREQRVQAHAALSLARIVGRDGPEELRARYRGRFIAELEGRLGDGRKSNSLVRGAVMALGMIARPEDGDARVALTDYFENGRDLQARYLCLWALARIGGKDALGVVFTVLKGGRKALERPWATLVLGMAAEPGNAKEIATALLGAEQSRNPNNLAASAIALGLTGDDRAALRVRDLLTSHTRMDELAGYSAVAIALLGDDEGMGAVRDLLDESRRRPDLRQRLALALGMAGGKEDVPRLLAILEDEQAGRVVLGAAAHALGRVGGADVIEPLVRMAAGHENTLQRAFAVVALGYLASDDPLPWCAPVAEDLHYRAAVRTLVGDGVGLLEHY